MKYVLWSIGVLALLTIVAFCLVYVNKDKIKHVIVHELNKQLTTEIKVENIEVEFFSTFPMASLLLEDVIAKDAFRDTTQNKDTLFAFKKVYLSFNVWDILYGKYVIKKVIAHEGCFNMRVLNDGDCNYVFWKSSNENKNNNFEFSLNRIELRKISYSNRNDYLKQYYEIELNKAVAKGDFTSVQHDVTIKAESFLKRIQLDNLVLNSNQSLDFDIVLSNNSQEKTIVVNKGELRLEKMNFNVKGSYDYSQNSNIDLCVVSDKVKLESMMNLLPQDYKKCIQDYKSKGDLFFDLSIKGKVNNKNLPNINANFRLDNAELYNKKLGVNFSRINLIGNFSNGKERNSTTSFIEIKNFSTIWNQGSFSGRTRLSNFSNLNIEANVNCSLPLDVIQKFLQQKEITKIKGLLNLNLTVGGSLSSIKNLANKDLSDIKMSGKGSLSNCYYEDIRVPYPLSNTNVSFVFNDKSIQLLSCFGKIGKSSFSFKGDIEDIIPFVMNKRKNFVLKGDLKVDNFKVNDWDNSNKQESKDAPKLKTASTFGLPLFLDADINTDIGKLSYDKISMEKFKARVRMIGGNVYLERMSFNAFLGDVQGDLSLITNSSLPKILGKIKINNVDVQNFFYSMDNFGQSAITSKNIKGRITSTVDFSTELGKGYELKKDKVIANVNYRIENGELNDVSLLKKLSYFIDESSLNNVKFQSIESGLNIQNGCVTFQDVDIKSNAVSFSIFGNHYFDQRIDYHIKIKLSELASKRKKAKLEKQQKEFGEFEQDENSKMTLYVKIGGTLDKPTFAYDFKKNSERAKQILKTDRVKITNSIDKDLKLGIEDMKKDKTQWKKQEKGEYVIEWEETKQRDTIKIENKKETKFNIEWE